MNNIILTITLAVFLTMVSCNERQHDKSKAADHASFNNQSTENNIVTDSVTNEKGKTVYMTFNNTNGTASFIFEGDTINLKQDTMGSGIKYSNDHYQFTEWHGHGELKKDNITIFSYTK